MRQRPRALLALATAACAGCAAGLREVQLGPADRARLADAYPLLVFHYRAIPELQVVRLGGFMEWASESLSSYRVAVADPVGDVQASFVEALRRELGERSAHPLLVTPGSAHASGRGPAPEALRELLGPVVAIDLETIGWRMPFVSRSFPESRTTYGIEYFVRGRLLRLSDGQVLWQGICAFMKDDAPRPLGELAADDWALLRARRAELASGCAEQLLGSFMGRTQRSLWDGRNKPRSP